MRTASGTDLAIPSALKVMYRATGVGAAAFAGSAHTAPPTSEIVANTDVTVIFQII